MSGKLKMDDIAALTGYSVSTVSRVLSGKAYTSDRARNAIIQCARKLGVLDELAFGRLLIKGIAVFAPARTFNARGDIFYREVTKGIADALAPWNIYLSWCGLEEQRADVGVFLDKARHKDINAIIIIGTDDPTILNLAATLNKPCVLINTHDREMRLDAVSPDHYAIGFSALNNVFERGHRRILTITSLRRETLYDRLNGVKDAYRFHHVAFNPQQALIVTEGFSADETQQSLRVWLNQRPSSEWPEVIFPGSVGMTAGVIRVLEQHRVRIPQDMSLITTDFAWNLENLLDTRFSGIAVPCRELGVEAVHVLQNRLNRPEAPVYNLLLQGTMRDCGTVAQATRHAARAEMGCDNDQGGLGLNEDAH